MGGCTSIVGLGSFISHTHTHARHTRVMPNKALVVEWSWNFFHDRTNRKKCVPLPAMSFTRAMSPYAREVFDVAQDATHTMFRCGHYDYMENLALV